LVSWIPVISSYYIWHRNCLSSKKKEALGGKSIMPLVDDTEAPAELAEEEKDFLKSLEKMAEEIEREGSKQ
jgi:hypothetical protein